MRLDFFFIKTLFYDECHTKNILIISSSCASGRGTVVLVVVAPLMVPGQKGKQTFWMAASCAEFKDSTAARVEEESGSTNKRSRFYGMSQLLVEYLHLGPPNGWMGMMWWMIVPIVRRRCGSERVVWISSLYCSNKAAHPVVEMWSHHGDDDGVHRIRTYSPSEPGRRRVCHYWFTRPPTNAAVGRI